eukprot:m.146856 g.146856  ORF g.146856 m.146856 type:complete len:303 (+) comp14978_c0_seq2:37-945(+)
MSANKDSRKRKRTQSQWVCIAPDIALKKGGSEESCSKIISLKHGKTGQPTKFLLTQNPKQLFEINKFEDDVPRSWFLGEVVQQDGSFLLVTPCDPVFTILHLLRRSPNKFMILDQILEDSEFPSYREISGCQGLEKALSSICDVRGDSVKGYKLLDDRLTAYLKAKVERLELVLSNENVATGSSSALFSRGKKSGGSFDRKKFAFGIICEYLDDTAAKNLGKELGYEVLSAKELQKETRKKRPASMDGGKKSLKPKEDYSSLGTGKSKSSAPAKQSAAAKSLAKVDKKGMKSISAFFGKKKK